MMKLSKNIPAQVKTVNFLWCKEKWLRMSDTYKTARLGMPKRDSCEWCGHSFIDNEWMSIACPEKGRNMLLCQDCVKQMTTDQSSNLATSAIDSA